MRRAGPQHLSVALADFTARAAPATVLARVQAAWPRVAGKAVAAEAEPDAERAGTLTVRCRSAAWAHELTLVGPDLLSRLNAALEPSGPGPLKDLRVRMDRAGESPPSRARPR